MANKILFVVEGEKTEPELLKHFNSTVLGYEYEVYSYKTVIHSMYDELAADQDLDLKMLLREHAPSNEKYIFDLYYTDIFLIFDFDPQDPRFDICKLKEMHLHFNSSEKGLVLLSYPMIEALGHLNQFPDHCFSGRIINKCKITSKKYKKVVKGFHYHKKLNGLTQNEILQLLAHHLVKANNLMNEPSGSLTELEAKLIKILDIQNSLYELDQLQVLSTAIFYLIVLRVKTLESLLNPILENLFDNN